MTELADIKKTIAEQEAKLKEAHRKFNEEGFGLALVNYEKGKLEGMRQILTMVERDA